MGIAQKEFPLADGRSVTISQLPATRSWTLFVRLLNMFGPGAAQSLDGMSLKNLSETDVGKLGPMLQHFFASLTPEVATDILKELMYNAYLKRADGLSLPFLDVFDQEFAGRMREVFQILFFALKLNYQDFFSGLGGGGPLWGLKPPNSGMSIPSNGGGGAS